MTGRPILFSGPMVKAILDGRKTQTRRVLRTQPVDGARFQGDERDGLWLFTKGCFYEKMRPPFAPGDRLWVKESAWICPPGWTDTPANPMGPDRREVAYKADDTSGGTAEVAADYKLKLSPSIFMPRWASRLTLHVTDVRVQRVQDISEGDAEAEGVEDMRSGGLCPLWRIYGASPRPDIVGVLTHGRGTITPSARDSFSTLWGSLNAKRGYGWDANPWVVAVTFDPHFHNIDRDPTTKGDKIE